MKKICIIGPCLKMGGMERASCNFANSLHGLGYEVVYVAIFKQTIFFKLNPGIAFIEPPDFNRTKLNFNSTVKYLRKSVKMHNPDSVFVLNKLYSALTLIALAFSKYPVFISERSSPFYKWDRKIDIFCNATFKIFPPRGVVAQTSIAAKYQKQNHRSGTKFKIVPNPVREINLITVDKQDYVLAIGRFNDPNKGFDRLVSAFAQIKDQNWKLVFAGGDEDGDYLKKQAAGLNIIDRIVFLGKVDVDSILSQAKIFVIPSRSEGFPNALCEAMAAGLACIAFDFNAGPRDIITHETDGIIVEDNNIGAMAQAIDDLISNEDKRKYLSENALRIKKRLNSDHIGKELSDFILS